MRERVEPALLKFAAAADSIGIMPWHLSLSALILGLASFCLVAFLENPGWNTMVAVVLYLLSGAMDGLDGALARYQGSASKWGAFYDSLIDRVCEAAFILGLMMGGVVQPLAAYLYAVTSQLISYTRARAEALDVSLGGVGLMERAERMIILSAIVLLWIYAGIQPDIPIYLLILLNVATVVSRVNFVRLSLRRG